MVCGAVRNIGSDRCGRIFVFDEHVRRGFSLVRVLVGRFPQVGVALCDVGGAMGRSDRVDRSARRVGRTLAVVVMAGFVAVAGPAAVSEEGRNASFAPAAVPGAPSAPRSPVAAPADGEAHVSWVAPSSSGASAITSYVVTPYRDDVAGRPLVFRSPSTRQIVSGLTNGKIYSFTIAARSRGDEPEVNADCTDHGRCADRAVGGDGTSR